MRIWSQRTACALNAVPGSRSEQQKFVLVANWDQANQNYKEYYSLAFIQEFTSYWEYKPSLRINTSEILIYKRLSVVL